MLMNKKRKKHIDKWRNKETRETDTTHHDLSLSLSLSCFFHSLPAFLHLCKKALYSFLNSISLSLSLSAYLLPHSFFHCFFLSSIYEISVPNPHTPTYSYKGGSSQKTTYNHDLRSRPDAEMHTVDQPISPLHIYFPSRPISQPMGHADVIPPVVA